MSNYYNSKTDRIISSEYSNKAEVCQFVTKAKDNLYTDDASFTHKRKCLMYINNTLTEAIHFYDNIGQLNADLINRAEELYYVLYNDDDTEERMFNETLILFKV